MRVQGSLRRLGLVLARFVGLAVVLAGAWLFLVNVFLGPRGPQLIYLWILSSGLVGVVSGLFFLFSVDGPARFRSRTIRLLAWLGMVASLAVPHYSVALLLVPLVILALPTFLISPDPGVEIKSG